ncbi:MAG: MotA/TolQ/ExbB proton channel family protein [Planctomycetota bacterium]|nr:MotA/TolQ/ExbB proton channel family protein [Planctomycetota bacterium]
MTDMAVATPLPVHGFPPAAGRAAVAAAICFAAGPIAFLAAISAPATLCASDDSRSASASTGGGGMAEACRRARERLETARMELLKARRHISGNRAALKAEMGEVEEKIRSVEHEAERLEGREADIAKEAEKVEFEIAEYERELRRAVEVMLENRKDLQALAARLGPTGEMFERFDSAARRLFEAVDGAGASAIGETRAGKLPERIESGGGGEAGAGAACGAGSARRSEGAQKDGSGRSGGTDRGIGNDAEAVSPLEAAGMLFRAYLACFEAASRIRKMAGAEVVLPNGTTCRGTLMMCGAFGGMFVSADGATVGVAAIPPGADRFHVEAAGLNRTERAAIGEAVSGRGEIVPAVLDITSGAVSERRMRERSWGEWFAAGGPVMYPLALIAILALLAVLERAVVLGRMGVNVEDLLSRVLPFVRAGDLDGAMAAVRAAAGGRMRPAHRVLAAGITHAAGSPGDPEDAVEEAVMSEVPGIDRHMGALSAFATVSPLLGLLGTITGMIRIFQILTVHGAGSGRLLSGGISEALITTEFGLAIAIPVLLAHAALTRRARAIKAGIESVANGLVAALRERPGAPGTQVKN